MNADFFIAWVVNLAANLCHTILALTVGVLALKVMDRFLLKKIDIEVELKNNNIAVAIFASTILLFVAILVGFGLAR